MRFPHRLLTIAVMAGLCACTPTKPDVVIPQIVTQTVTKYVPVPVQLTEACPIEKPKQRTVGEAVRVAKARRDALEQCNRQLDQIRQLSNQP